MRNRQRITDYDGGFLGVAGTVCDLVLLNLFFMVSCLPVVTVGAAVSSMSHVTMKLLRGQGGGVWREYWSGLRSNWKQATVSWVVFLALCAVLLVDWWILPAMLPAFYQIPRLIVATVFLAAGIVMLYLLPALSHFQYTLRQALKSAALMAVAHFPATLALAALHGACLLVFLLPEVPFLYAACFFLVCGFSVLSLLSSYVLNRVFANYESV